MEQMPNNFKGQYEPISATKNAYAAILAPREWDNYKLWHLMYSEATSDIENLGLAAQLAGLEIQAPDTDIFHPNFEDLIYAIKLVCKNPKKIINIFEKCARQQPCDLNYLNDLENGIIINAILNPTQFDNTKFWLNSINYSNNVVEAIHLSTKEAGYKNAIKVNGTSDIIQYPSLPELVIHLQEKVPLYLNILYINIKGSALSDQAKADVDNAFKPYLNETNASTSTLPASINPQWSFQGKSQAMQKNQSYNLMLKILGGVLMTLGTAAVLVAFTVLNAATLGTAGVAVAGTGAASMIAGLGFFNAANNIPAPVPSNSSNNFGI